jgi:hypothetical protein
MGPPALEPIDASEGGLEVLRARQGDSLDIDFQAIGLVLGMLVDTPASFLAVRALSRRFPCRVVWRPANTSNEERQVVEAFPGGRDEIEDKSTDVVYGRVVAWLAGSCEQPLEDPLEVCPPTRAASHGEVEIGVTLSGSPPG